MLAVLTFDVDIFKNGVGQYGMTAQIPVVLGWVHVNRIPQLFKRITSIVIVGLFWQEVPHGKLCTS